MPLSGLSRLQNDCTLVRLHQPRRHHPSTPCVSEVNEFFTGSDGLKKAFTALMTCSPAVISLQLNKLFKRISQKKSSGDDLSSYCGELLLRLNSQFPGDGGCFCIYFLNHIVLKPGEAMFLGPNLPHAYLAGGKNYDYLTLTDRFHPHFVFWIFCPGLHKISFYNTITLSSPVTKLFL